jgi:hypothetical protein
VQALTSAFNFIGNKDLLEHSSVYILASQFYTDYTRDVLSTFIPYFCATKVTLVLRYSDRLTSIVLELLSELQGSCIIVCDSFADLSSQRVIARLLELKLCCLVIPKNIRNITANNTIEFLATLYSCMLVTESISVIEFSYSITCTLDLNKSVYVIPGSIYAKASQGSNYLIRNGAILVTAPSDVNFD